MKTLTIQINGDTICVAADHPFSVAGKGWISASKLSVGDRIRWRGVESAVEAITDGNSVDWRKAVLGVTQTARMMGPRMIGFAAGTPIPTTDGVKKIEEIKPGDQIIMRDPRDPELAPRWRGGSDGCHRATVPCLQVTIHAEVASCHRATVCTSCKTISTLKLHHVIFDAWPNPLHLAVRCNSR